MNIVNYGTQPDERVETFEDYDWEQVRKIKYRTKTIKGFITLSDMVFFFHKNNSVLQFG